MQCICSDTDALPKANVLLTVKSSTPPVDCVLVINPKRERAALPEAKKMKRIDKCVGLAWPHETVFIPVTRIQC